MKIYLDPETRWVMAIASIAIIAVLLLFVVREEVELDFDAKFEDIERAAAPEPYKEELKIPTEADMPILYHEADGTTEMKR